MTKIPILGNKPRYFHLAPPQLFSHLAEQAPQDKKIHICSPLQEGKRTGDEGREEREEENARRIVHSSSSPVFYVLTLASPLLESSCNYYFSMAHCLRQVIA